jgi:hypothetical protein
MPIFHHIVLLKFKESTSQVEVDAAFSNLANLKEVIPGILSFTGGPNTSHEGLSKGYSHAFLMVFENEECRDNYLPHVEHERVKNMILPLIDDIIAFDYAL